MTSGLLTLKVFLEATHKAALAAAANFGRHQENLIAQYYHADGATPLAIPMVFSGNGSTQDREILVPLLAITPLSLLGIHSLSINMRLHVRAHDGDILVRLAEGNQMPGHPEQLVTVTLTLNMLEAEQQFMSAIDAIRADIYKQLS